MVVLEANKEMRGVTRHPAVCRAASCHRELSGPSVNAVSVEEPCVVGSFSFAQIISWRLGVPKNTVPAVLQASSSPPFYFFFFQLKD